MRAGFRLGAHRPAALPACRHTHDVLRIASPAPQKRHLTASRFTTSAHSGHFRSSAFADAGWLILNTMASANPNGPNRNPSTSPAPNRPCASRIIPPAKAQTTATMRRYEISMHLPADHNIIMFIRARMHQHDFTGYTGSREAAERYVRE